MQGYSPQEQSPAVNTSPTPNPGDSIKFFPNGDRYVGQWSNNAPNGAGLYQWVDGSYYEGDWLKGQKHGRGMFVWPSGSKYWGEWVLGEMQGVGTYQGADSSFYTGNWVKGLKHGLGRKRYPNGDVYEGFWSHGAAQGTGRYRWSNGNEYIGDWRGGTMTGVGTFKWDCGDLYEGEWEGGFEHGRGLFSWQDGSLYEGTWSHGLKDGKGTYYPAKFGKSLEGDGEGAGDGEEDVEDDGEGDADEDERYPGPQAASIGDMFDAVISAKGIGRRWRARVADKGEIRGLGGGEKGAVEPGDKAAGKLPPKERVEHFLHELKRGESLWEQKLRGDNMGKAESSAGKAGEEGGSVKGKRRPVLGRAVTLAHVEGLIRANTEDFDANKVERSVDDAGRFESVGSRNGGRSLREADDSMLKISEALFPKTGKKLPESAMMDCVTVREYIHGTLVKETAKEGPCVALPKQLGIRREGKKTGETVLKGHKSYDLMRTLQLGISYSVGNLGMSPGANPSASQPDSIMLTPNDYTKASVRLNFFPREGSKSTPSHALQPFKWKDYCPNVFSHLRSLFGVSPSVYLNSLCGLDALRELSSPGKSGSVFYLSNDDRFIIKTMRRHEVQVLLRMLKDYVEHVHMEPSTLLIRFFGLHQVHIHRGRKLRFVVMWNLFRVEVPVHRRYDLKGSWQGRSTDKTEVDETTTLKDLDLDLAFLLHPPHSRASLLRQLAADCAFLRSQNIMDYSLLLGLHFKGTAPPPPLVRVNEGQAEFMPGPTDDNGSDDPAPPSAPDVYLEGESRDSSGDISLPTPSASSMKSLFPWAGWRRTPPASPARGLSTNSSSSGHRPLHFGFSQKDALGRQVAATAMRMDKRTRQPITDPETAEAYEVVLHFGIIDILQEYDLGKKVEHLLKSVQYEKNSISAVDPLLYAQRFQDFMAVTFPED